MSWILRTVAKNKKRFASDHDAGSVQMKKYGLLDDTASDESAMAAAYRNNLPRPNFREHIPSMAQSAPTTPLLQASSSAEDRTNLRGGSQTREESVEEQILRRRRREAMVFEDEGRPISSANIIERSTPEQEGLVPMNRRRSFREPGILLEQMRQHWRSTLNMEEPAPPEA